MKRNNELVLKILTTLSRHDDPVQLSLCQFVGFPDLDQEGLDDHVALLEEKGFIAIESLQSGHSLYVMTWEGDDFIGYSQDVVLWRAATQVAGHLSFDHFYAILKDLILWKARNIAEEISQKKSR